MQVESRPQVSVLIVTGGDPATLGRAIRECLQLDYPESQFEILIYDNGASSAHRQFLDEVEIAQAALIRNGRLRVMRGQSQLGLGAARNAAARAARGNYLCYLDGDAYPARDWLSGVMARFGENGVGVVSPRVVRAGQPPVIEGQGATLNYFAAELNRHAGQPVASAADFGEYVLYASGCGMATRRQCWDAVGGFDDALGDGHGDADYGIRVWTAGYKVVTAPEAIVYHEPKVIARESLADKRDVIAKHRWRIMLKHWPLRILGMSLVFEAHLIRRHHRAAVRIRALMRAWRGLLLELPSIIRYRLAADRNAAHTFWFLLDHRHHDVSGPATPDKVDGLED